MMYLHRRQFSLMAFVFQVVFIILFKIFCRYVPNAMPSVKNPSRIYVNTDYPLFQDIHVMVFVGFGFLMSFLKRYGFSAISVNLLLSAFIIQWVILLRGFLSIEFVKTGYFLVSINELMIADLSCIVVLISMGVLLGKLTPVQFLILGFMETSFSVLLEHILFTILHINDGGRSLVIHCFGAYFGLAAAKVIHKKNNIEMDSALNNIQHSELFSMIGTLFLWIFFPSLNAAEQETADARHRAIMNTYLAMASCTVATFMISSLSDNLGRFNMLHIQSSTLAGGVAMGTVANVILYPHHAVTVGAIAGVISVIGHVLITPRLEKKLKIFDTCGVHNTHGLPGLLSGIISVILVLMYDPEEYGKSIHKIYPYWKDGPKGGDRDQLIQAYYQTAGIIITILVAIVGGFITGLVLRFSLWNQIRDMPSYEDTNYYSDARFTLFGNMPKTNGTVPDIHVEHYETTIDLHQNGNGTLIHAHESMDVY